MKNFLLLISIFFLSLTFVPQNSFGEKSSLSMKIKTAQREYNKKNYERVIKAMSQYLLTNPSQKNSSYAYFLIGLSAERLNMPTTASITLGKFLKANSRQKKNVYQSGLIALMNTSEKMSIPELGGKNIVKLSSKRLSQDAAGAMYYGKGIYYLRKKKAGLAKKFFRRVKTDSVEFYPRALIQLGVMATKARKYNVASKYFERAIKVTRQNRQLKPLLELAKLNLARVVYASGKLKESVELYSRFTSNSPYWLTILRESSWPLMRLNDTTVSLGNLHTVTSPFYEGEMVGEAYILRATILFALCKYEEMRRTLNDFNRVYKPLISTMKKEKDSTHRNKDYYQKYVSQQLSPYFLKFVLHEPGFVKLNKALEQYQKERKMLSKFPRLKRVSGFMSDFDYVDSVLKNKAGFLVKNIHSRRLKELVVQQEQANYLQVEVITGEKELIENTNGIPAKRVVEVDTEVFPGYYFWPYKGEFWKDELGSFVYTTESACINEKSSL